MLRSSSSNINMDLKVVKKSDFPTVIKTCSDCHTSRTPLWRGGPAGPKSLCNACGIKYNKKRRKQLGLVPVKTMIRKKKRTSVVRSNEIREILKMRFLAFGRKDDNMMIMLKKLMSKLREEEQAALLLMALSCGSTLC